MQSPNDPSAASNAKRPSACETPRNLAFVFGNFCVAAVMLSVALAVVTIECGFYEAFENNRLDFSPSAFSSVLALLGVSMSTSDVPAAPSKPKGGIK